MKQLNSCGLWCLDYVFGLCCLDYVFGLCLWIMMHYSDYTAYSIHYIVYSPPQINRYVPFAYKPIVYFAPRHGRVTVWVISDERYVAISL